VGTELGTTLGITISECGQKLGDLIKESNEATT